MICTNPECQEECNSQTDYKPRYVAGNFCCKECFIQHRKIQREEKLKDFYSDENVSRRKSPQIKNNH